jgi:zinc carboxypeptidase/carboxypeptidase M14-like protein
MKKFLLYIIILFIQQSVYACQFDNVTFEKNFEGGKLDRCSKQASNRYLLTITPENIPINNSPWYAFRVTSKDIQETIIDIKFEQGNFRYLPKISNDGKNWSRIPFNLRSGKLRLRVKTGPSPLWVAGQELIDNNFYKSWLKSISKLSGASVSRLGYSTEKREILQLTSESKKNKEWVIILGRMHPPEVTGALALFPFVQTLFLDKEIGKAFRERFNILVVPNLNPDGVANGYWRHNANGVDLNRDWNEFKQIETQQVHEKLLSINQKGGTLVYGIDFHSTSKDIFYTMPSNYGLRPAEITNNWLNRLDKYTNDIKVRIKPGNNPDKGIFKQYFADNFGVHAITYEMGDQTDRKVIIKTAKLAAESFMLELLKTPHKEFIGEK